MTDRLIYGRDINAYIDKAVEKMKDTYFWATREMFRPECSYAIEEENGRDVFVSYFRWSDGSLDREVLDCSAEEFIERIVNDNSWWVEDANPVQEVFKVPFRGGTDAHGWTLERYEFRSHQLGGYSSLVEAGNRSTGGTREFFLPQRFFEGTFEDFLEQYCELVPGWAFGLYLDDLEKASGLKSFLGFSDKISPQLRAYINKNAFCSEYLFRDWEEFLKVLYEEGARISDILFWDHCLREKQEQSLGQGGYIDPDERDWMYAETQIYEAGFEDKSPEEVREYIRSVMAQYPDHELVPSFYLDE